MLELKHIAKTYKTTKGVRTEALKDINLRFPQRGMVFVLGKSGSGKSTLLNIIGGLDQADTGEIIINGKSSADFKQSDYDSYRNTYVGFIFQEFNLMEEYTIEKNIAMALQLQQKEASSAQIEQLLERLGLSGYATRYPNELSGGQKQRVAIARALIKEPQILMADEPTGALDSATGKEIFDTLKELSREKLVIVVSHDRESAQAYANRIIEFKDGVVECDTAPDVDEQHEVFEAIHSHLPFKDSFRLGFSCLGHKKIRMVFTILLTSFALLLLALSDAVGNFSSVNAQYKAAEELQEPYAGVRYQYLDENGNTIYTGMDTQIKDSDIHAVLKENEKQKFAKVYSWDTMPLRLGDLGIEELDSTAYSAAVEQYKLTEMSSFDTLGYKDIKGSFPKDYREMAISSYLADIILSQGIADEKGKLQFPKTYDDILKNVKLPIGDTWMRISGIVVKDTGKYESLKKVSANNIDSETYKLVREFRNVANISSNKLYVKDGFVNTLKQKKGAALDNSKHSLYLHINEDDLGLSSLAYPIKSVSYYDGTSMMSTKQVKKDEILLSPDMLMQILGKSESFYSDAMAKKSTEEIRKVLQDSVKRLVGKSVELHVDEGFGNGGELLKQQVRISGVLMPEGDFSMEDVYQINDNMVNQELIAAYIPDTLYVSELLGSFDDTTLKPFLEKYDIDSNLYANTVATQDVKSIKDFARFATRVFFYASIALFIFAAVLMMNFIIVSISYRKKDIGILRAIGARSTDVLKIFIWEGVMLAVISYVITMIGLQLVSLITNTFAKEEIGVLISPVIITLRQPLLMLVIVAAVTFIACILPVTRIARQRPIDAIKK
ncbi:ABC transporter ATP-binding protein/permease [[Clostridium] innocuum]|nr:ABC transporter ATP-binding protein/permease [[Clostridium] innocuum]